MKKNFRPFIKGTNWALSGLLTLLGFPGCSVFHADAPEYGVPHASYTFRGRVSNESGEPVPDIKIEVARYEQEGYPALSNAEGRYSVQVQAFPSEEFAIIASDIDGEKNGAYRNDTIPVAISDSDYYDKGDDRWNHGPAQKEVNIVLKKKD
ncbi:MAG: radical SAM-associated putative lipoprotein [Tannerella sp.]|jgi:putative lipoprotein (rSAM/lipoprotein system)|nr:radical SAM-associated putative lipoprotein [Tannerella sp.]